MITFETYHFKRVHKSKATENAVKVTYRPDTKYYDVMGVEVGCEDFWEIIAAVKYFGLTGNAYFERKN